MLKQIVAFLIHSSYITHFLEQSWKGVIFWFYSERLINMKNHSNFNLKKLEYKWLLIGIYHVLLGGNGLCDWRSGRKLVAHTNKGDFIHVIRQIQLFLPFLPPITYYFLLGFAVLKYLNSLKSTSRLLFTLHYFKCWKFIQNSPVLVCYQHIH